jgi:hypothetical protein
MVEARVLPKRRGDREARGRAWAGAALLAWGALGLAPARSGAQAPGRIGSQCDPHSSDTDGALLRNKEILSMPLNQPSRRNAGTFGPSRRDRRRTGTHARSRPLVGRLEERVLPSTPSTSLFGAPAVSRTEAQRVEAQLAHPGPSTPPPGTPIPNRPTMGFEAYRAAKQAAAQQGVTTSRAATAGANAPRPPIVHGPWRGR